MGKAQLQELEKNGKYYSVPRGISMRPMLRSRQDIVEIHKLERCPKRYDLVLYIRGEEQGVIHRVLHVRDEDCILAGDNCWRKEYISKSQIVGIAARFYRNGKWYEVTNKGYCIYVYLWTNLFFIRRPVFFIRDKVKQVYRRIWRTVKRKRG